MSTSSTDDRAASATDDRTDRSERTRRTRGVLARRPPWSVEGARPAREARGGRPPPKRPSLWALLALLLAVDRILVLAYQPSPHPRITVPYSYFTQQVHARNVASVTAHGSTIQGTFRRAVTYPAQTGTTSSPQNGATSSQKPATATYFATTRPTFADDHLLSALLEEGAVVTAKPIQSGSNPLLTSSAASCQRFC